MEYMLDAALSVLPRKEGVVCMWAVTQAQPRLIEKPSNLRNHQIFENLVVSRI